MKAGNMQSREQLLLERWASDSRPLALKLNGGSTVEVLAHGQV